MGDSEIVEDRPKKALKKAPSSHPLTAAMRAKALAVLAARKGELERPATVESLVRCARRRLGLTRAAVERTVLGEMRGKKDLDWFVHANAQFTLRQLLEQLQEQGSYNPK